MTISTRPSLKSRFETGDTPEGSDFADLIDSFIALQDNTVQELTGGISGTVGRFAIVSAQTVVADTIKGQSPYFERANDGNIVVVTSASNAWQNITLGVSGFTGSGFSAGSVFTHLTDSGVATVAINASVSFSQTSNNDIKFTVIKDNAEVVKSTQLTNGRHANITAMIPVSALNQVGLAVAVASAASTVTITHLNFNGVPVFWSSV